MTETMEKISEKEKAILKESAKNLLEIASLPVMEKRRKLWYSQNSLKNSDNPLILAFPEGAWKEMFDESILRCESDIARGFEYQILSAIFNYEVIKDDKVVEPEITIDWKINFGGYGVELKKIYSEEKGGAYRWEPPIIDIEKDMKNLHFREVAIDREKMERQFSLGVEIFDGILSVRKTYPYYYVSGLSHHVADFVGLERLFYLPYDNPEGLKAIFDWTAKEHQNVLNILEDEGVVELNNKSDYCGSGGVAYSDELPQKDYKGKARLRDTWGFTNSQETVGLSPEMYAEFIFPYEYKIMENYGLTSYGCCEPIHDRLESIFKFPNIRRISVSPWSDVEICAEKMKNNFVYSRKPNPALICSLTVDENAVREDLRKTLWAAGDLNLEIIMKDTHTVQGDVKRIPRWVEIAREEVAHYLETR